MALKNMTFLCSFGFHLTIDSISFSKITQTCKKALVDKKKFASNAQTYHFLFLF